MSAHSNDGPQRPLTLADVAKLARVGESTVSRVLRGHGSFSQRTRERVISAVEQLGYVHNRLAGTLASSGSNLVGVVIPSLANIVFPDVLRGLGPVLDAEGCQPVIGVTDYDLAREEELVRSLLAWRPRAMILSGLEHSEATRAMLKASGVRVAELLDIDGEGIDIVVGFSNRAVGEASARHLIACGYRSIGYVGHDLTRDHRARKRYEGFCATLKSAGVTLAAEERSAPASSVEAGRESLARLLSRTRTLEVVYFSNDDMAIGGYFHALAGGIAVPDQLGLMGYNGLELGQAAPLPLTTVRTPRLLIGESGARAVFSIGTPQVIDTGFELVPGATTRRRTA